MLAQSRSVPLVLAFLACAEPRSDGPKLVADDPSPSHRVVVELTASLGNLSDPELIASWPTVVRDGRGRLLVTGTLPRTQILVYDGAGNFVESWGREGDGEGEFRDILRLVPLPPDSLIVIDLGARRLTVLDRDGRYARSMRAPMDIGDIAVIGPDAWIASGLSFHDERTAHPLRRLSSQGEVISAFGGPLEVVPRRPSAVQRAIAADTVRRGVWSIRPDRYELELWSADGERLDALDRAAAWFPDREFEGSRNLWSDPIHPRIRGVRVDDGGRLWVMGAVPKEDWEPSPDNYGGLQLDALNLDTMIEVIDPETGTLLASQRFPWIGAQFANDGSIVAYRTDANGVMVLDVRRATLTRDPDGA